MQADRRYAVALVVYCILGLLIWFTLGDGKIHAYGREIELRLIPAVILAGFVLKTVLHHHADRIRSEDEGRKQG